MDAFGIANIAVSAITAPKEDINLFISSQSELQYKTSSFANNVNDVLIDILAFRRNFIKFYCHWSFVLI